MTIDFVKMEGAGNDYIYVDAFRVAFPLPRAAELARRWSHRHFGIGGDGLIVLSPGDRSPVRMSMWNADGSRGAMCGNGLRCVAKLAHDHGHVIASEFSVETDAGERRVTVLGPIPGDAQAVMVRTEMGSVATAAVQTVEVNGARFDFVPGDAGNPHAVFFVADLDRADVLGIGAALQHHPRFPDGVNAEFVQVLADGHLRQRTFERGSGETLACGTGAAAVVMAARQLGHATGNDVRVDLLGGTLRVLVTGTALAIEGPARTVCRGTVALPP